MFTILFIVFLLFSLVYGLFSAAIIYHLRQYEVPHTTAPRAVIASFLFLSFLFWSFAIYFLIEIKILS